MPPCSIIAHTNPPVPRSSHQDLGTWRSTSSSSHAWNIVERCISLRLTFDDSHMRCNLATAPSRTSSLPTFSSELPNFGASLDRCLLCLHKFSPQKGFFII
ncbi:hypothetical protein AOQ84DRAFT_356988 [Glonium stellatum]|uniref:Uncharacterized protein n=1 Tax=Glonium stellatum TaxID=574774 RepID=A0A8E2ERH2_9PEZI|nr:hypothetical protein AOQ84DRAFT_356988 [Glonium stellatum]